MEMDQPKKFLFLGNDAALDLVNTTPVLANGPVDLLASFGDLVDWLAEAGLTSSLVSGKLKREKVSAADAQHALDQVKTLREALRVVVIAIESGVAIPKPAMADVNRVLRAAAAYSEISWDAHEKRFVARWLPHEHSATSKVLVPLSRAIIRLLTERDLGLIRRCENPACVLHYYDTSKNHSRRWCSMDFCGNRMKVAAHYRRHRGDKSKSQKES